MKFGDILRYPDDQGVGDSILFMYLAPTYDSAGSEYRSTMVVRTTEDDDIWEPGSLVTAGINELIPYEESGGVKVFAGIDPGAVGSSTTVSWRRDASGTFLITDVRYEP